MGNYDNIKLSLPMKPEYVVVARLAVSGILSRLGFDMDAIEDVKVSVSEVCSKIIKIGNDENEDQNVEKEFEIIFEVLGDKVKILFICKDSKVRCIFKDNKDDFGLALIQTLMDELDLCNDENYIISFSKFIKES